MVSCRATDIATFHDEAPSSELLRWENRCCLQNGNLACHKFARSIDTYQPAATAIECQPSARFGRLKRIQKYRESTTMKAPRGEQTAAEGEKKISNRMSHEKLDRRGFVVASVAAGATLLLPGGISTAADMKKTFTILHTNDLHSNLIGLGPASDYTPFTLNDDTTRGGFARLASLIASPRPCRVSMLSSALTATPNCTRQ
jgi:hypothetical protein